MRLALIAQTGEMGYPPLLSAKTWGFYDVSFSGQPFKFQRPYGSYVMENVLFKIFVPRRVPRANRGRSRHDAACAARRARPDRRRHRAASPSARTKPPSASSTSRARSNNPADRDHCIQYMVAVPLIFGRLTAEDYEDASRSIPSGASASTRCARASSASKTRSSRADYHDPDKRSIANALTVELKDGTYLPEVVVEYPIGHRLRRAEGIPLLVDKFERNLARRFTTVQQEAILEASNDQARLEAMPVDEYVSLYVPQL